MSRYKYLFSIAIILIVNFLFVYKYSSRVSSNGLLISLLFIAFQIIVIRYYRQWGFTNYLSRYAPLLLFTGIIGFLIYTFLFIDITSINVDRHSVISSFIDTALRGEYPYLAESHRGNYPGPMPFYFIIAFPFYWIGELAILSALGYVLITGIALKEMGSDESVGLLFMLATSVFMFWEIATRSNIFTYSVLVAVVLGGYLKSSKTEENLKLIISGLFLGLLLSTRSVYIIPYVVFLISAFIKKEMPFRKQVITVGTAVLSFVTTFVPLLVLYGDQFFEMNPFVIQSSFLIPSYYIPVFIIISLGFSFLVKTDKDKYLYSGLSLFIAISIYFVYHIANSGFHQAYFGSIADISYFLLCVPFLMFYLMKADKQESQVTLSNR